MHRFSPYYWKYWKGESFDQTRIFKLHALYVTSETTQLIYPIKPPLSPPLNNGTLISRRNMDEGNMIKVAR